MGNLSIRSRDWKTPGQKLPPPQRSSASMSFSWLFLGGMLSSRARLRFTNRGQCAVNSVCRSRTSQRTANYLLTVCLTPGGKRKEMINLHTFGEGMVPEEGTKGSIPAGKAKCVKGISGDKDKYPNKYEYDETTQSLFVGDGVFRPVSKPVFDYEISGFHPVHSWLGYRMQERTGKSSSPLDEIRPRSWTADMTDELLQVLWTIEKSLEMAPKLAANLDRIIQGPLLTVADVPEPTKEEKKLQTKSNRTRFFSA